MPAPLLFVCQFHTVESHAFYSSISNVQVPFPGFSYGFPVKFSGRHPLSVPFLLHPNPSFAIWNRAVGSRHRCRTVLDALQSFSYKDTPKLDHVPSLAPRKSNVCSGKLGEKSALTEQQSWSDGTRRGEGSVGKRKGRKPEKEPVSVTQRWSGSILPPEDCQT